MRRTSEISRCNFLRGVFFEHSKVRIDCMRGYVYSRFSLMSQNYFIRLINQFNLIVIDSSNYLNRLKVEFYSNVWIFHSIANHVEITANIGVHGSNGCVEKKWFMLIYQIIKRKRKRLPKKREIDEWKREVSYRQDLGPSDRSFFLQWVLKQTSIQIWDFNSFFLILIFH